MPPELLELPEDLKGLETYVRDQVEEMVERAGEAPSPALFETALNAVVYDTRVRIAEAKALDRLAG